MKLKKEIIERIWGNDIYKQALVKALQTSIVVVRRMLRQNRHNGPLTSYAALSALMESMSIDDAKLLIDENSIKPPRKSRTTARVGGVQSQGGSENAVPVSNHG